LELRHRLVRQTIDRAITKAMEDMEGNTGRGIRKLIDLGLMFSTGENQKWFFRTAREVVSNPKNTYNRLISGLLSGVKRETLRTVGLNLGYSSLIYGARKLQRRQRPEDGPLPWLLVFDCSGFSQAVSARVKALIREGREAGIYSYIFRLREPEAVPALCAVAAEFGDCFFAFEVPAGLVSERTSGLFGTLPNAAVSVALSTNGSADKDCARAFRHCKKSRCLTGFHFGYREDGVFPQAGSGLIREAVGFGCVFGMFFALPGVSEARRKEVYGFVTAERSGTGFPLVAFEWDSDLAEISRRIHVPAPCGPICPGTDGEGSSLRAALTAAGSSSPGEESEKKDGR
jgi:hypothetical protein